MSEHDKLYVVVDVETTMNGEEGRLSDPFNPNNKLVAWGIRTPRLPYGASIHYYGDSSGSMTINTNPNTPYHCGLLVGHNLHFDLHYLRRFGLLKGDWQRHVHLWDTQLAEYLLTGQEHASASLDELTGRYVGAAAKKDEDVTAIFKSGKGADHVPRNKLTPYLEGDVINTETIFLRQVADAIDKNMLTLIHQQMDALLATEEMTYNGMHTNLQAIIDGMSESTNKITHQITKLNGLLSTQGYGEYINNVNSPSQLSTLLFGGVVTKVEQVPNGTYKNGKPKTKKETTTVTFDGWLSPLSYNPGPKNKNGYYSVDDAQLHKAHAACKSFILNSHPTLAMRKDVVQAAQFIEELIIYREIQKQHSTYWKPIFELRNSYDGCIHHNINHCITRTGRQSSSRPNLQNITNGDIKKVFDSRWDCGIIIEADYSQLEMIELAIRTKDKQLIKDIEDGVDMHNALHEAMYGTSLQPKDRKNFKRCSFALIYGAGAKGIAEQANISEEDAKKFIATFYARYPNVLRFHDDVIVQAHAAREPTSEKTVGGFPRGKATLWDAITNRRYVFKEYDAPEFLKKQGKHTSFSPTELKNYFIQGGATGDKVPLACGLLLRVLKNNPRLADKCLLINTVHDSVMFDCHPDVFDEAVVVIRDVMERMMPAVFEEAYKVKLPLKFKVGISAGPNWLDQEEIKV